MPNQTSPQPYHGRKVLVLGDDYRMVLPIVRSLGRQGIEVHLGWCPPDSPVRRSRYAAFAHDLPWYSSKESDWLNALNRLVEREQFDLVIPATEHAVYALQTRRSELASGSKFYLLDENAFQTVSNKDVTYATCDCTNIPYPRTIPIDHIDRFDDAARTLGKNIAVKPSCSVSGEAEFGKAFVRCCQSHEEAREYTEQLLSQGVKVSLQQHVTGEGVGVELLVKDCRVLAALQHRRLHETKGFGSTYRETVPLHDELLAASRRLMAAINYTGVAMVEFRVDPQSGNWALLEVNGRFWGSLPLASAAGFDFPLWLFEMFVVGRTEFPQDYQVGVRSRALTNDIRWMWRRAFRRGTMEATDVEQLGWATNDVSMTRVLHGVLRGLTLRDHADAFARDDIRPAVAEVAALGRAAMVSLRKRLPNIPAETFLQQLMLKTRHSTS